MPSHASTAAKVETPVWYERDGRPCDRAVTPVNAHTATYSYRDTCRRCGGAGGGAQWAHTGWACYYRKGCGETEGLEPCFIGQFVCPECKASQQHQRDVAGEFALEGAEG